VRGKKDILQKKEDESERMRRRTKIWGYTHTRERLARGGVRRGKRPSTTISGTNRNQRGKGKLGLETLEKSYLSVKREPHFRMWGGDHSIREHHCTNLKDLCHRGAGTKEKEK